MMIRRLPIVAFALLLVVACSTSKPATRSESIDPVTDPTIVGSLDEAVLEARLEGEDAARTGRRIGHVVGIVAAVLGGPESESVDDAIDRYYRTRDAVEVTSAVIGATKGAVAGAQRGYQLDLQFAELHEIEGLEVLRPFPDEIVARLPDSPSEAMLAAIAAVFVGREERYIDIDGAGDAALDIRESLIQLGVPESTLHAHRNDEQQGVVLRIRYAS